VVDVFDSLHTARPYRAALAREAALSIVKRETEAGFWDPAVVSVFLDVLPHLPPA
jgi:HD-GYP domain-containing protein (c-di-GMP phosphodiesterase class II)